jgi:hypothetical protein
VRSQRATGSAFYAMLMYNLPAALYLLFLGISGEWVGILLWPAVVVHVALTTLLAGTRLVTRRATRSRQQERSR